MRKIAIIGNSVMLKASLSLDQLNAILMFFNGLEIGFGTSYVSGYNEIGRASCRERVLTTV